MENKDLPLMVTIRCLTYNHEPYIRQCLEGFVMQKTNFRFEAIVHDDASTDGTAAIIREYAEKYPDIIKPIFQTENQYSKHDGTIRRILNEHTHGKYVAMCEGDDYWTDPLKLQKQVDFLESNRDYVFCCTRYKIFEQETGVYLKEYAHAYYRENENLEIDLNLFTKVWVTQILTTLIRTDVYLSVSECYDKYKYYRDVHMYYLLLLRGKGISLNDFTGVYRWHAGGVASKIGIDQKIDNGYKIYNELYLQHKGEYYIRRRYKKALIDYVRYQKEYKKAWAVFKENSYLYQGIEKMDFIISFVTPSIFFRFLLTSYTKKRINKLKE